MKSSVTKMMKQALREYKEMVSDLNQKLDSTRRVANSLQHKVEDLQALNDFYKQQLEATNMHLNNSIAMNARIISSMEKFTKTV